LHLQAASTLSNEWRLGLQARLKATQPIICGQEKSPSSRTNRTAFEFFTSVISWYDTLSCASTGLKPFSSFDEEIDLKLLPQNKFEKLMGCEDWLIRIIMEIATLNEWKRRLEASSSLSTWELVRRAADIKNRLQTCLAVNSGHQNGTSSTTQKSSHVPTSLTVDITRVFASAAIVYLEVVVLGPYPELPEIRQGVSRTMNAFDALTNKELVKNLLWPVCIAGSMATFKHQPYWTDLVLNVSQERLSFAHPNKVLKIMEECWSLRKSQSESVVAVDWMTAMRNLDMTILLV